MKKIILFGPPGAGKGTFSGQIKKILPDIVFRLSNLIKSPDDFNKWLEAGGDKYLEEFNIHGGKTKDKLFNKFIKWYIENGYIKIQKNIQAVRIVRYKDYYFEK